MSEGGSLTEKLEFILKGKEATGSGMVLPGMPCRLA